MVTRFETDDLLSQRRQAVHLNAAQIHEQSSDFFRNVGEVFASLGLPAEGRHARLAADRARRSAERERTFVSGPRESDAAPFVERPTGVVM